MVEWLFNAQIQEALLLSKVLADSEKEQKEYEDKDKKYPHIPKCFKIQKKMLSVDTRRSELQLIDQLTRYDNEFKKFLFTSFIDSFKNVNEKTSRLLYIPQYQNHNALLSKLNNLLKTNNKNSFKHFIGKYLNDTYQDMNIPIIVLMYSIMYISTMFIVEFAKRIMGMEHIWLCVNNYLN